MNRLITTAKRGEPIYRVHRNFFVGLFVLLPVVCIPLFVIYTLAKSEFFEDWCSLHVEYENSYGLEKGNVVTVSGIRIGYVRSVALMENGHAHVTFRILERDAHVVRKNSKAILKQKNMVVGDWQIELTLGDRAHAPVEEGDTLSPELPLRIDKVIEQVKTMVGIFEEILQDIADGKGVVGHLLKEDTLVQVIYTILADVRRLIRNADGLLRQGNAALDVYIALGESGAVIADSLSDIMEYVKPLMADVGQLMTTVDGVGKEMYGLIEEVRVDVREAELLLKALQDHWLLRRSVRRQRQKSKHEP